MKQLNLFNSIFMELEEKFEFWLFTLGYAKQTVYSLPIHLREFFHYLEKRSIFSLNELNPSLARDYLKHLKTRSNTRKEGVLEAASINKHQQALKKFSEYLHQNHQIIFPLTIKTIVQIPKKKVFSLLKKLNYYI